MSFFDDVQQGLANKDTIIAQATQPFRGVDTRRQPDTDPGDARAMSSGGAAGASSGPGQATSGGQPYMSPAAVEEYMRAKYFSGGNGGGYPYPPAGTPGREGSFENPRFGTGLDRGASVGFGNTQSAKMGGRGVNIEDNGGGFAGGPTDRYGNSLSGMADALRQLSAIRMLNGQGGTAASGAAPTGGVIANQGLQESRALMDKWGQQDAARNARQAVDAAAMDRVNGAARIGALTSMYGTDVGAASHALQDATTMRGQDLQFQGGLAHNRNAADIASLQAQNAKDLAGINANSHLQGIGLQGQNALQTAQLNTMGHLQGIGLQGMNALALEDAKSNDPLQAAHAKAYDAIGRYHAAQADQLAADQAFGKTPEGIHTARLKAIGALAQAGIPMEYVEKMLAAANAQHRKYAEGGQVESPAAMEARMCKEYGVCPPKGAAPAPQPQQPQQPQRPGPSQMQSAADNQAQKRGALNSLLNYAEGGPIDVSGRQVLGAGTPKSDSLPAVIDGEHPAALSTEEFVMPVEAVRHFGLAKLHKMVDQARKGLDTGRGRA